MRRYSDRLRKTITFQAKSMKLPKEAIISPTKYFVNKVKVSLKSKGEIIPILSIGVFKKLLTRGSIRQRTNNGKATKCMGVYVGECALVCLKYKDIDGSIQSCVLVYKKDALIDGTSSISIGIKQLNYHMAWLKRNGFE